MVTKENNTMRMRKKGNNRRENEVEIEGSEIELMRWRTENDYYTRIDNGGTIKTALPVEQREAAQHKTNLMKWQTKIIKGLAKNRKKYEKLTNNGNGT